jgi:hypothetical protein
MLLTMSPEVTRALWSATALRRLYPSTAAAIRHARLLNGRFWFDLMPGQAAELRAWCDVQVDIWRYANPDAARVFEGAAADITAAILGEREAAPNPDDRGRPMPREDVPGD